MKLDGFLKKEKQNTFLLAPCQVSGNLTGCTLQDSSWKESKFGWSLVMQKAEIPGISVKGQSAWTKSKFSPSRMWVSVQQLCDLAHKSINGQENRMLPSNPKKLFLVRNQAERKFIHIDIVQIRLSTAVRLTFWENNYMNIKTRRLNFSNPHNVPTWVLLRTKLLVFFVAVEYDPLWIWTLISSQKGWSTKYLQGIIWVSDVFIMLRK